MKKSAKVILIIFTIVLLMMIATYMGVSVYFNQRFFPGSVINGIDASSKTVVEVEQLIANKVQDYTIYIKELDEKEEVIGGAEINFEYVPDGTVQQLKDGQNSFYWIYAYFHPSSYSMTAQTAYDVSLLKEAMERLDCFDEKKVIKPADAYIKEKPRGYELIEEVTGDQLNPDKVFTLLKEAVDKGEREIDLVEADCYLKPAITSEDKQLQKKVKLLNKYASQVITYKFGEQQEILDYATTRDWMTIDDHLKVTYNWNKVADWMTWLSNKYDTLGKDMEFTTSLGETVTVKHQNYGWAMDQEQEVDELLEILKSGKSEERTPKYLETGRAYGAGSNDIGDTYIEIDYTNQRMWFYKDGQVLVDTPIVTGNTGRNWDSPEGIFCVFGRETMAILKGEGYKTPVDFWMPFHEGVGVHDAKWRPQFGGTIYQSNGSHGCINTPWDRAKLIFENIEIGVPVICYRAATNLGQGPVAISQPAETRVINEQGEEVTGNQEHTDDTSEDSDSSTDESTVSSDDVIVIE